MRRSLSKDRTGIKAGNGIILMLTVAVLAAVSAGTVALHLANAAHVKAIGTGPAVQASSVQPSVKQTSIGQVSIGQSSSEPKALASSEKPSSSIISSALLSQASAQSAAARAGVPTTRISLPMFFEPNQGQTDPQVKFVAHGSGYGLFLTADEAVLDLHRIAPKPRTPVASPEPTPNSVIRMKLDGANSFASVSGAQPLPGKSSYFIGNDSTKWHHDIPQFGRVQYGSVYPGIDLVYYGDQGQLEYDFRVAPGAPPEQIAMTFDGASARIDSGASGDLILSTDNGEIRFRAPRVYQSAGNGEKVIAGNFRQLAGNKIGFTIGKYDHSRELVIDPVLSYSTYIGGSATESLVNMAVDSSGLIYLVGSTTSDNFPLVPVPTILPLQTQLSGTQNIFIAVLNPNLTPANTQLLYATYLGGSGSDSAAGAAVSTNIDQGLPSSSIDIYVAGSTTSPDFPVSTIFSPFQGAPNTPGMHGFLTRLNIGTATNTTLRYSTYLSGNGSDTVTGLAIDNQGDAFVTGTTTSTDAPSNGFPANPNGFQTVSNAPHQFFASEVNTKGSGPLSMIYSTYLGGGNPQSAQTVGGGIAVDPSGNVYISGATNFLQTTGPNGEAKFPLNAAYQACLDEASRTQCSNSSPTALDAFVAKITPKPGFTLPVYCTYMGGSGDDYGYAIAVDSTGNAYVTGTTSSDDWVSAGSGFQTQFGGNQDAFIGKIGNLSQSIYPLNYFTYLGGSGVDVGQAILVDSTQTVRVVGWTTSTDLLVTPQTAQSSNGGGQDAFAALIVTTLAGRGAGDFLTYLGGNGLDQGTAVALDVFGTTYVAGTTQSTNFPIFVPPNVPPFQGTLNGAQNAFVAKIGAYSQLLVTPATSSPSPQPVAAGTQVTFTFNITNNGPDVASQVVFTVGGLPNSGQLAKTPTATVTSTTGSCIPPQGQATTISCIIPTLSVCSTTPCTSATVQVNVTPAITTTLQQIVLTGQAVANNSNVAAICTPAQPPANIVNFNVSASTQTPIINAGDTATFQVVFTPTSNLGYNANITPSQTTSPAMVTATTPTFNPTPITLSGSSPGTTTLSIATVARPVTTGSLRHSGSFYATWLPMAGLSLVGLGLGAGRKRRRWLAGLVLCLIAGAIVLQSGCGSSSTSANVSGGTAAGVYTITITGSAGSGASRNIPVQLQVN